ncbi:hypothetical protein HAX54_051446 [Datura stramonium]|uniref:Uncharacterized protein n=1 Tax=Datura stramonium TaxID=4076 RepID=A0ABS8WRA5_DATST|nr:hypothetical protein [Datura stramonium]
MCNSTLQVPVVDLSDIEVEDRRKKIVDEIREASEKWGLFQLINHGVPSSVLEGMIDGARKFHEQDVEVKKEYYTSDPTTRRVRYDSNLHLCQKNWKDTLVISRIASGHIEPEEIPPICRKASLEYINHVTEIGDIVLGLLSEALGLKTDHLKPRNHSDPSFLTILLQDQNGGLQVMCDNQWADVAPIEHGLVVNIGDLLQTVKLRCQEAPKITKNYQKRLSSFRQNNVQSL